MAKHTFPGVYVFIDTARFLVGGVQEPVPTAPVIPAVTTFTISGTVTEDGLPKPDVSITFSSNYTYTTDQNGSYVATVARNYTGASVPVFSGGTFTPTSRTYATVISNYTSQDFVYAGTGGFGPQPEPPAPTGPFLLSGTLFDYTDYLGYYVFWDGWQVAWNQGVINCDSNGQYSILVDGGFNGTVSFFDDWGTSTPASYSLTNVQADTPNLNFDLYGPLYLLGGTIWDNTASAPLAGQAVEFDTYPTVFTDDNGVYSLGLPWTYEGNITPIIIGDGSISPASYAISFPEQLVDLSYNFQYFGPPPNPVISGTLYDQSNYGALMPGVTIEFTGIGFYSSNDVGVYNVAIPSGATFDVVPTPVGGVFTPDSIAFVAQSGDSANNNFNFNADGMCPIPEGDITPLDVSGYLSDPSAIAADNTQGYIWAIDDNGPLVAYYDVVYGTVAGAVSTTPGGDFGQAGIVYDPVTNKVVTFDYNTNIQIIDAATQTVVGTLAGPSHPNAHMLCLADNGTVFAASSRWVAPSLDAVVMGIDLNTNSVVSRRDQTIQSDSICWASNIERLVINQNGLGLSKFYLYDPVTGNTQASVATNTTTFNYENYYIKSTGELIQGFNSGSAVEVFDIVNGTDATTVYTLTGYPQRAAAVAEDTCNNRLFVSTGYDIYEFYTSAGNYGLVDSHINTYPGGLAFTPITNLVYYTNWNNVTLESIHWTAVT